MSDLVERLRNEERRVRKFLGPITATQLCKEAADEIEQLESVARNLQRKLLVSGHYEPSPELAETDAWCKKHLEWTRLVDGTLRCDQCEIERLRAERKGEIDANRGHAYWETAPREELLDAFRFQGAMTKALISQLDELRAERDALRAEVARQYGALTWALGCNGDFREQRTMEGAYWWRGELAERAGLFWNGEKYLSRPIDAALWKEKS